MSRVPAGTRTGPTRAAAPAQASAEAERRSALEARFVRHTARGPRLVDAWGRGHDNLRISVTDRCNFACTFCHNEGQGWQARDQMTPAEIERAARIAAGFGMRRIKLTGGEPTLRGDIVEIVERLRPLATDLSMTTNGILLPKLASRLAAAGLDRVNVSLHSLDHATFARVTGRDALDDVLLGIDAAIQAGLSPIKVNTVVMKGHNVGELEVLGDFARRKGLVLQLIELDSPDDDHFGPVPRAEHVPLGAAEKALRERAVAVERRGMHGRVQLLLAVPPGSRWAEPATPTPIRVLPMAGGGARVDAGAAERRSAPAGGPPREAANGSGAPAAGGTGTNAVDGPRMRDADGRTLKVEFVRPQENPAFCAACTRIRVTADGEWKSCLNRADNHVPFLAALRSGASDDELAGLLLECIARREPYWR